MVPQRLTQKQIDAIQIPDICVLLIRLNMSSKMSVSIPANEKWWGGAQAVEHYKSSQTSSNHFNNNFIIINCGVPLPNVPACHAAQVQPQQQLSSQQQPNHQYQRSDTNMADQASPKLPTCSYMLGRRIVSVVAASGRFLYHGSTSMRECDHDRTDVEII